MNYKNYYNNGKAMKLAEQKIIEQTQNRLIYRLNYVGWAVLFYGGIFLFISLILSVPLSSTFLDLPRSLTLICNRKELTSRANSESCELVESILGFQVKSTSFKQLQAARFEENNETQFPYRKTYRVSLIVSMEEVYYFGINNKFDRNIVKNWATQINNFITSAKESSLILQDNIGNWSFIAGVIFAAIPLGGWLWLVQTVGFYETWIFDKLLGQITIKRRLAISEKVILLKSKDILEVKSSTLFPTDAYSPERYQVIVCATPLVNLGSGAMGRECRVLYESPDATSVKEIAVKFKNYLNLT